MQKNAKKKIHIPLYTYRFRGEFENENDLLIFANPDSMQNNGIARFVSEKVRLPGKF